MNLMEMFITEDKQHCSFCFGRFNPPNAGHAVVFQTVEKAAEGGDWFIFTSKSQDPKKNPLTYEQKVAWLYRLHPNLKAHLIEDPNIKTYLQAAVYLYNQGYKSATFVAGTDDIAAMKGPLEQYNGVESKHGMYDFRPLRFVVSPSPEGRSTDARNFAVQNNLQGFQKVTGIKDADTAQELMMTVRHGMNVKDEQPAETMAGVGMQDSPERNAVANETKQRLDPKCWKGYKKQGTKMKGGTRVNNCVKIGEAWEAEMAKAIGVLLENFADGKNPGRKGLAKRSGVNTKASVSDLRKTAKTSTGEKARMAHWLANMKAGKAKK
jgi:hypothetical protein